MLPLIFCSIFPVTTAEHAAIIDTSMPYLIISTSASRSPNEYFYWSNSWNYCRRHSDEYDLARCVPSEILPPGELPPSSALWWFKPVETATGTYYHIVSGIYSERPAQMLSFDWQGDAYPRPWYDGDAQYTADYMNQARFSLQPASHVQRAGDAYYILCGPESGKANEMLFFNRAVSDWLDTWSPDFTDEKALWRLVPAPCESYNCTQPDYAAACVRPLSNRTHNPKKTDMLPKHARTEDGSTC